jgi:hypothetical protein
MKISIERTYDLYFHLHFYQIHQMYPELSIKEIYAHYKSDETLMQYLPDKYAKGRQPDREFFFNVFNTLFPSQLKAMIDNARAKRFDTNTDEVKAETIEISQAWYD